MIIELRKYNEVRELLIEIEPQGCRDMYAIQVGGWRVSVTTMAVHMGVKEMGMQTGHRGAYNWSPSQE